MFSLLRKHGTQKYAIKISDLTIYEIQLKIWNAGKIIVLANKGNKRETIAPWRITKYTTIAIKATELHA
jgi:hypothetical protein